MILIKIRRHARLDGVVVLVVPEDGNTLMGGFGPARLSPADRGYLLAEDKVESLLRFLARHDVHVLDERFTEPVGPLPYDPLPECVDCGYPVTRPLSVELEKCPACRLPWVPHQPERWTPVQAAGDAADRLLERLPANVAAARAALGHLPVETGDATAARAIACPWCHAPPYSPCVVPATGRPLTVTAAHPARHEAAGVGPPRVVTDELAARRSRRDGPRRMEPAPEEATS